MRRRRINLGGGGSPSVTTVMTIKRRGNPHTQPPAPPPVVIPAPRSAAAAITLGALALNATATVLSTSITASADLVLGALTLAGTATTIPPPGINRTAALGVTLGALSLVASARTLPVDATTLTTFTFVNNSGSTMPVGHMVSFGQAFPRGAGGFNATSNCVKIRNAADHADLVYQLDEIASRVENGDDGTVRHLVWSVQWPAPLANGAQAQVEFVTTGAAYGSPVEKQSLAALAAAHDLKLHFSDMRNQDGSVRGSGNFTFRVNDNIANVGADAPRKCATGPVRDSWIVMGKPVDDVGGAPDPELYVQFYLDLTTSASDQASIGNVRYVPSVMSPWQNAVSPAQDISYYPQVRDGANVVLDWSNLNESFDSALSPVNTSTGAITVPASTGSDSLYMGQAVLYHTTGTPPTGLTNNKLYWVFVHSTALNTPELVTLMSNPSAGAGINLITPSSQGSGTHHLDHRVWHPHLMRWYALDTTAKENWTNGTTSRYTTPVDPALTAGEQLFWEETGSVPPLQIGAAVVPASAFSAAVDGMTGYYNPLSHGNVIGGSGVGARSDIGLVNEFFAQAFVGETADAWRLARVFASCYGHYPYSWMLGDTTHRLVPLNNGPLTINGNGGGGSYSVLGAPQPHTYILDIVSGFGSEGVAHSLQNTPDAAFGGYGAGMWSGASRGYLNDHMPAFSNGAYQVFGSRHLLDDLYAQGNRAMQSEIYDGEFYRSFTLPSRGRTYYSNNPPSLESRAGYWSYRDKMLAAAFGADSNPEKTYFGDLLAENFNFWTEYKLWEDGSGTGFTDSFALMAHGSGGGQLFMDAYGIWSFFQGFALLRDPLGQDGLFRGRRLIEALFSETLSGAMSAYWGPQYWYTAGTSFPAVVNGQPGWYSAGGDVGQYFTSSASDIGSAWTLLVFDMTPGNTVTNSGTITDTYFGAHMQAGDRAMNLTTPGPSELQDGVWYNLININNTTHTFQLENPATPGVAFPHFTFPPGNTAYAAAQGYITIHYTWMPPTSEGWLNPDYVVYARASVAALRAVGFTAGMSAALSNIDARGFTPAAGDNRNYWNPSVVVP